MTKLLKISSLNSLRPVALHVAMRCVIQSFAHKGLKAFWETESTRGINPDFAVKIKRELDALEEAGAVEELDVPGFGLHALKGDHAEVWSMTVTRNWRMTFRFKNGDAYVVDLEYYH